MRDKGSSRPDCMPHRGKGLVQFNVQEERFRETTGSLVERIGNSC